MKPSRCQFLKKTASGRCRCHVSAHWRLTLLLEDKLGRRHNMSTPLKVCNRHRADLTVADVLDERTWKDIKRQMATKGHTKLRRTKTRLYYDRVGAPVQVEAG